MNIETNADTETFFIPRRGQQRQLEFRIFIASYFELMLYLSAASLMAFREYRLTLFDRPRVDIFLVATSPAVLLLSVLVIVAIFFLLLTGRTPLVAIAISGGLFRWIMPTASGKILDQTLKKKYGPLETPGEKSGVPVSSFFPSTPGEPSPSPERADTVEENFAVYIDRSQNAVRIAQRRPNALLFVGTLVALFGLVFFVLTLPGSRYGFLDVTPNTTTDLKTDFWATSIQLVPRLLMLIFIQVLAGFFLRQYRSSMEDFRYYEAALRHREAQYLSYTLRKRIDDKKALLKFADELLKEQEFGLLSRGQTTAMIEVQKAELNEFSSLYEKLAALVTRSQAKTKKEAKSPSDVP